MQSSYSFVIVFAIVMSGISIYNNISAKVEYTKPDVNDNDNSQTSQSTPDKNEDGLFHRIFECFDIVDNYNRLFQPTSNNNLFSSICGIRLMPMSCHISIGNIQTFSCSRTVICIWTIAFHINYHSAFTLDNIPQLTVKMEYFMYQPVFQAYLYVDAFFVLRCDFFEKTFSSRPLVHKFDLF